ncbi:MAG: SDR family oxidoreductase [Planctomycetaceae bacterium]|jgi:2-dehydro-3-deoxy-D-gluconate 5-dehydrogenase|nr:SDR family oxidoreductase [Planctomycetaceae bacterium]MBT6487314.1 SDR family oxidoreductase [Planctomycetaceae bacterium]MBT6496318.1 SDR family oxidoreductase [Planctomycetaceae bacterium]
MILDLFKLNGRTALVTGGSRGLGQAIARGLAEAGADVACVSRSGEAAETARLVEGAGRKFLDLKVDLSHPEQRKGIADQVVDEFGSLDILVNNAGTGTRHPPEEYPENEWRDLLEVHLTASFDLSQQAAPFMFKRGRGKIINIGSVMCYQGGWQVPAYTAAKHGLAGLTKSLATSWSSRGINVNCIAPGYFATDLTDTLRNHVTRGPEILNRIPCGRWGEPDDLAGLAVFLASDASNYMHGSIIPIDGGWLAR